MAYEKFAKHLLEKKFPKDVEVLKLEVPSDATIETDWVFSRLTRERFYLPTAPERDSWDKPGSTGYKQQNNFEIFEKDSDAYVTLVDRKVAVTPINLVLTANVDFNLLDKKIRQ